ncbi:MAG: response regulator transcription factor [Bacteroidia bacterium]|nr:response regulator transcription factor [Bacteroidia bacterium]
MKILIADSQPVTIEGIKSILSQFNNIRIIEEAENKITLFEKLESLTPEILIIDIEQIAGLKISDIGLIEKISPDTNLFIFQDKYNEEDVLFSLEYNSVKAYHLKNCKKVDFVRAITVISNNGKSFCETVIECLHKALTNKKITTKSSINIKELTKRETEIVKLVAEGKTAKVIAEKLFISIHTVNTYRKNILKKLGVKNSSELVLFAIKSNLIDSTDFYI